MDVIYYKNISATLKDDRPPSFIKIILIDIDFKTYSLTLIEAIGKLFNFS